MKEKSSSLKTAIPSEDFVIRLLDATRKAREWSGRREGPRNTDLGDRGSQIGLWGEDAGADYIETYWPDLEKILLAYAESRNAEGTFTPPIMGKRARTGMIAFISETLPGFKIEDAHHQISVSWTDLC